MIESTEHLLKELSKVKANPQSLQNFQDEHPVPEQFASLSAYLKDYMQNHPNLQTHQLYIDSNLSKNYADQFFNGHKEHPGKYKLIPLCMAMGMNLKETNRALRLAKQPVLDPRNQRDMAIIVCINEGKHTVYEVNQFLNACQLEPIS